MPGINSSLAYNTAPSGGSSDCRKLLLDGQQRLTSLTAVLGGELVSVRGRKKPIDILFNLEHPEGPPTDIVEVESDEDPPRQSDMLTV